MCCDRFAQIGQALRGTVMSPALVESLLRCGHDVSGRGEIGLADFEMDNILTLRLQGAGAHKNVESRFDADAGHSFCELHGSRTPLSESLTPLQAGAAMADFFHRREVVRDV